MNLNFIEEFKNYSNLELLKIIKNVNDYQPAAVEAAQTILSSRSISQEELEKANDDLVLVNRQADTNAKGISKLLFSASVDQETSKWLKFLWLALAVQYAKTLYNSLPSAIYFLRCKYCPLDYVWALTFLNILYIPIIFFLLLRKSKWGWVFLFGETIFTGVSLQIVFLQTMIKLAKSIYYLDVPRFDVTNYLWFIFIRTFLVIFLLKVEVTKHFNVEDQLKIRTIIMATVLNALLLITVTILLYGGFTFS